tara:strand:- start:852 stop:1004 length:153 start_codon:yes stop_codon:yes gene_type:complete
MPPNKAWTSNYDKAFLRLTAKEWAVKEHIELENTSKKKISYKEFKELVNG